MLKGVSRAYFVHPIGPGLLQGTASFGYDAKEAGVDFIVNVPKLCSA